MDPKTVERRRSLFWEVFSGDMFHVRSRVIVTLTSASDYPSRVSQLAVHHLSVHPMSIVNFRKTMVMKIIHVCRNDSPISRVHLDQSL